MKYLTFDITGWCAKNATNVYEDGVIEGSNFVYIPADQAVKKVRDIIEQVRPTSYGAELVLAKAYLRANPGYANCESFSNPNDETLISVTIKTGEESRFRLEMTPDELWVLNAFEELCNVEMRLYDMNALMRAVQEYQPLPIEEEEE